MKDLSIEYDRDFCYWLEQNVALLRAGKLTEIDIENISEELESMGKSQHHELISRLRVLFIHLLKWQYQPEQRSSSWKGTIVEQREQIFQLIETSPSLKHEIDSKIIKAYRGAVKYVVAESGLAEDIFPCQCPYTLEQILNEDFYPQ